jgi:nucleotide-binding universal stress UspA family protein
MLKIEHILCPVDFSEFSARAYDYAYSLARHYGARLYLEHVIQALGAVYPYDDFPEMAATNIYENLSRKAEKRLQEMMQKRSLTGPETEAVVDRGYVPESILAFAENKHADLIVMGTHGRRGLDRLMMGSVTESILRKAPCPVLAVRRPAHDFVDPTNPEDSVRIRKILFCLDFSPPSLHALPYALSFAQEYEADLTLLHVLEEPPEENQQLKTEEIRKELAAEIAPEVRNRSFGLRRSSIST